MQAQAQALAQVAGNLASAGQHDQAETIAHPITSTGSQAHVLAQLAMALTAAGDTVTARRMTAAALATGAWQIAAVPALTLNASAWAPIELSR